MTRRIVSLALVGLLLVSSLAGPAAAAATAPAPTPDTRSAATATTQDNTTAVDYAIVGTASVGCMTNPAACASGAVLKSYSTDSTAEDTKISLHSIGVGEYESATAYHSLFSNYLQDTGTIASIDARNAIGTAYEQGNTTTTADQMARSAIYDYYSVHMKNMLNYNNKQVAQLESATEIAKNSSEIDDSFVSGVTPVEYNDVIAQSVNASTLVDTKTKTAQLPNGTEINYLAPVYAVQFSAEQSGVEHTGTARITLDPLADYNVTPDGHIRFDTSDSGGTHNFISENVNYVQPSSDALTPEDIAVDTPNGYIEILPTMNVQSISSSGLESATVYDFRDWLNRSNEIDSQSATVSGNYVNGFSEDIYTALDNGEISVSDLRGIDGQARHLIGDDDANVTDDRYETAALTMLGIAQPNASQTSTMVVEYTGYTDRTRNATTGEWEFSDRVEDRTYQGLLFAQELPTGGFETGTTYNTTDLDGTVVMANETAGTQDRFVKGEFTIESMYNEDGEQVENTDYDEPRYDSYNSTEYITYINKSTGAWEDALSEEESGPSTGGGGGISLPDVDGLDPGSIFGGVVIMVLAGGAVVVVVLRG
ncbi:hypothetical protein [Halostella salina]|uniref:hypothetical protein n=1 Tax=Halostella salina TaxID=1547897 RepID=UPI000EF84300|nr:hypothetical protein [Halostella salina]